MRKKVLFGVIFCGLVLFLLIFVGDKQEPSYSIKTFKIEQGWGYSIFNNNKLIIRQPLVPSIQEKKHFVNEYDALVCGKIMLKKLKLKKIPSVTLKELQQNNIHL